MARDGVVLSAVKRVARAFFEFDLRVHRWRRRRAGEKPFALGGDCRRCARCCEAPALHPGWPVRRFRSFRATFIAWQRRVNGFHFVREDPRSRAFIFRCEHFDTRTRRCDSYETRPGICRDYPRALLFQPEPEFLEGCGYKAISPGANRMMDALRRYDLTEEQMAKLKKGLYLD